MEERLQKIIARAGKASRRAAERFILDGRIRVNGEVVSELGAKADPERDLVELDGRPLRIADDRHYYLFNKPEGIITSMKDPRGRPSIREFLDNLPVRVFPVGRLDRDTEGLLILTNDGELAARLMHPRHHVPKTYRVKVRGNATQEALRRLGAGEIVLGDRPVAPAEVELIKYGDDRSWLKLTLIEGRNRQVRRMCSSVGLPVLKLKRIQYGPIGLGKMAVGEIRSLDAKEVRSLKNAAGIG